MSWSIRKAQPTDIPFIYSSWLKSFRHNSLLGKSSIRTSVFYENYREILDFLLAKSNILVACLSDEPEVILGYLVYEPEIVHYSFVKEPFRHLGIATNLLAKADLPSFKPVCYSHLTSGLSRTISEKYPNFIYNPFVLYQRD